jgi:hypothetical protein
MLSIIKRMQKKQYDKPYVCNDNSKIIFGKYKGSKHEVLKDDLKYCEWILSTEEDFAQPTKAYIKKYIII